MSLENFKDKFFHTNSSAISLLIKDEIIRKQEFNIQELSTSLNELVFDCLLVLRDSKELDDNEFEKTITYDFIRNQIQDQIVFLLKYRIDSTSKKHQVTQKITPYHLERTMRILRKILDDLGSTLSHLLVMESNDDINKVDDLL